MTGILEVEFVLLVFTDTGQHAVKDVVISFARILNDDSRLFQQVLFDVGSFDDAIFIETDIDVLAETRRVIITHRLGVSEGYKNEPQKENNLIIEIVRAIS